MIGLIGLIGLIEMDHAGYILGSYAVTLAAIGGFALRVVRQSRRLADQVDDSDKYWR